jgi:DNA polymerase-3 subunit epsilon
MTGRFVSIDVETANPHLSSICQIGMVTFDDNKIIDEWVTLVDPEDWFADINISIHGIDEDAVQGAPTMAELGPFLAEYLRDEVVVCHTHFDRAALYQALAKCSLAPIACVWLDSARVVRRCWEQFTHSGYGLPNMCDFLGIEYQAHDALEDARAAGLVLLHAVALSGLDPHEWVERLAEQGGGIAPIARQGDPVGHLFGEEVVFTGAMAIPRWKAAALASQIGCNVSNTFRKTTTILVVGDQDLTQLAGYPKSTKHRKAEAAIASGHNVRILGEGDFLRLVSMYE